MESTVRTWWRTRIKASFEYVGVGNRYDDDQIAEWVEEWLDDWMQTPELSLAELADSDPNYKLAVIDLGAYLLFDGEHKMRADYRKVIKMAD